MLTSDQILKDFLEEIKNYGLGDKILAYNTFITLLLTHIDDPSRVWLIKTFRLSMARHFQAQREYTEEHHPLLQEYQD